MSKYSADIEIAVRGGQQLDRTIKTLNRLNNSINVVTRNAKLLEGKGFNVASIENYSRAVSKAERAVRKAAEGTNQERQAITALVSAMERENKARERKNILIAREIANQRRVIATADAGVGMQGPAIPAFMRTGPSSPLRGSRAIPGSPAALAAGTAAARPTAGGSRLGGAVSGAIIGGSFPLLFGQTGGAAAGGAIGGLAGGLLGPGGSFAGSLLGTLLGEVASKGQQVKELATDIGFTAEQTKRLQEAFALAGRDSDKFIESVQNIRGLSLSLDDQADAVQLVSNLTETYGGKIEKVTNAFTSALESGRVTQATLNQLTSQGIPIQETLAKKYDVNRDKILQMAKDGKISVQDLTDTLVDLGNTADAAATKTTKGWGKAWEDFKRGASLALQGAVAVFNGITGAGVQSSGNIAAVFAAMYVELVKGAIAMGIRVTTIFANVARGAANLAATFNMGGANIVAGANVAALKNVETTMRGINQNLQSIDVTTPKAGRVGAITAPGQLPPSGGGKSAADKAAEDAAREAARVAEIVRARQLATLELQRQAVFSREIAQAEMDKDPILVRQLQGQQELMRLGIQTAAELEKEQNGMAQLAIAREAQAKKALILLGIELDIAKIQKEQQLQIKTLVEDLDQELALKYAVTEQERTQLRIAYEMARLRKSMPFMTDADAALLQQGKERLAAPKTGSEIVLAEIGMLQDELTKLSDLGNVAVGVAEGIGSAFANSFKGVISGSMTAREALAAFFQSVADQFLDMAAQIIAKWIQMTILNSILKLFPGGSTPLGFGGASDPLGAGGAFWNANANGNAFGANGIIPFAKGGIVNSPTLFPFANGTGLMGEAGPEAIMPLQRGANGKLGVLASGGGGEINVVVNVDASGSSVEGNEQEGQQLGRVIAAAIQQEMIKQKRPGGLLA